MNRRVFLIIVIISLLFSSCSKKAVDTVNTKIYHNENSQLITKAESLPENYTIDKIKSAFLEYINYRLWLYPAKIQNEASDKSFDTYIDKTIDVEIRMYSNSLGKSIYIHTSIGRWLAVFKTNNGLVYCDGQVNEGEYGYPSDIENYKVIEKYSIVVPQPHKPNYGISKQKDKMIAALEYAIKASCEDFYRGKDKYYDEWINVDVYIADFYEWEAGTHAWLCRQDGSITNYPVVFQEKNGEINVQTLKGYTIENVDNFDKLGHLFKRDINDAAKHFRWNPEKR